MSTESANYYGIHAEEFVAATLNVDMSRLYVEFEKYLKPQCRILDLGCGSGRDSKYFVGNGYDVIAVDASSTMCMKAKALSGIDAYVMKAEEIAFKEEFDAVWACASLLHVAREDQSTVLQRICHALKSNGVFYGSWKYGNKCRIEDGRRFTDLNEAELDIILAEIPGMKLIKSWVTTDVREDLVEQKWMNVLLRKVDR